MKKIIVLFYILGFISFTNAQSFKGMGDQKVQLGINAFGYGTGITGSYDYGVMDWLSIGAGTDFYWSDDDDNFFIFGRANFHLNDILGLPQNMDLYPGINIGGRNEGLGLGVHMGYRYFFDDKFGAFVELGSHGSLGIILNL
ncbi:hypothetical protein Ga0061079_103179 [Apibacter mensalis]|uniref:Outer membrane protein beta-barrel domain-containing protein n=1 Tax=Apibacter mensalis TaxID=1586267 RepID=A0A0X3APS0_9FLAO|nr:DUF6646 family protein [Apibacter mensalis]CVK15868.1 hypothetical protein Ga0061079_103179 [Apibacter mensalis]